MPAIDELFDLTDEVTDLPNDDVDPVTIMVLDGFTLTRRWRTPTGAPAPRTTTPMTVISY